MSEKDLDCKNKDKKKCSLWCIIKACLLKKEPCSCVCPPGEPGPMGPQGPQGEPGPMGPAGPEGPQKPFLSSYVEVLANEQTVAKNGYVTFDPDSADSVGNNIVLDSNGTTFTINCIGLYRIEWDVNLASGSAPAVIGIIENGEAASGAASSAEGNFSSGTLIEVDTVPFTISLCNYNNEITIENPPQWIDSAASIRITRFADGSSE